MSNRFHSKYHRRNHHTYTNAANPDAGHDPIASPENPFLGDFVLNGALSAVAPLSASAGYFRSNNIGLITQGNQLGLWVKGNVQIDGNLSVAGSNSTGGNSGNSTPAITYTFGNGLTKDNTNNVSVNFGSSLYIDSQTGQLRVNWDEVPASQDNPSPVSIIKDVYNFSGGVVKKIVSTNNGSTTFNVSAVADNSTITIKNGSLSLVNNFAFVNGLSAHIPSQTAFVLYDNDTIKLNPNGKLYSAFNFSGSDSALTKDSNNSIKVNVDGSTIKINNANNTLTSGYTFKDGLVQSAGGSGLSVGVNVDNNTIVVDSGGALAALGTVRVNSSSNQTISGPLTLNSTLTANNGIRFPDGTVLSTAKQSKPIVQQLVKLKTNYYNAAVITSDNKMVCWGYNDHWFNPGPESIWPPQVLTFQDNYNLTTSASVVNAVHTRYATFVLFSDGSLWASGYTPDGSLQLGINRTSTSGRQYSLQRVNFPGETSSYKIFISSFDIAGDNDNGFVHIAAIDKDGYLYTWGKNYYSALGSGTAGTVISTPTKPAIPVGANNTQRITQVKVFHKDGYATTLALRSDGVLLAAGYNGYGQLGTGNQTNQTSFVEAKQTINGNTSTISQVAKILDNNSQNYNTSYILKTDNTIWAAGLNNVGQLGIATSTSYRNTFQQIVTSGTNIVTSIKDMVTCGDSGDASHLAISIDGQYVFVWGYNGYGQLGLGNQTAQSTVQRFSLPNNVRASKIIATNAGGGGGVFGIIGNNGFLYVAGYYAWGQNDSYVSTSNTFKLIPLSNVEDAQIINDTANTVGIVIKDTSGRVYVCVSLNGHYVSGPTNNYMRNPSEFTNYLV